MIDDYAKTMELIEKMKTHLPIPAYAGKPLVHLMREQRVKIKPRQNLQIVDVLYLGDEGGIACAIEGIEQKKTAIVTSITHIRIKGDHPLANDIHAYQIERTRKSARINSGKPAVFAFKPKRKRRRRKNKK